MINLCDKCLKQQHFCDTLISDVTVIGNSLPIKISACKNFTKRIEPGHMCSDCSRSILKDCGATDVDVRISGGRIFECTKYMKVVK